MLVLNPPPERVPSEFQINPETNAFFQKQLNPFLRLVHLRLKDLDMPTQPTELLSITQILNSGVAFNEPQTLKTLVEDVKITKATVYNSSGSGVVIEIYAGLTITTPIAIQTIPANSTASISDFEGHVFNADTIIAAKAATVDVLYINLSGATVL